MRARSLNKCRQCGNRAELGVTSESGSGGTIWLCQRCAKQLGSTIAPALGAKIAAGDVENALRIQTGVQREAGAQRYRPVVVLTGLGQQREYVGEWGTNEAAATREAETMAANMRRIVGLRAREVGNN
jgi:hypothetical protein